MSTASPTEIDTEPLLAEEWRDAEFAADNAWKDLQWARNLLATSSEQFRDLKANGPISQTTVTTFTKLVEDVSSMVSKTERQYERLVGEAAIAKRNWEDFPDPVAREEFRRSVRARGGETVRVVWEPIPAESRDADDDARFVGEGGVVSYIPTSPDHLPPDDGAAGDF